VLITKLNIRDYFVADDCLKFIKTVVLQQF
jgi:hypothetical protein